MTLCLAIIFIASLLSFVVAFWQIAYLQNKYGEWRADLLTPNYIRVMGICGMIGVLATGFGLLVQLARYMA